MIDFLPGPLTDPNFPINPDTPDDEDDDYIWRGTQKLNPATGDFHPRYPLDKNGLSFFQGRQNMWRETAAVKQYRVGFTEIELFSAGFEVFYDGNTIDSETGLRLPEGHVSVKRLNSNEWNMWLHRETGQPYSAMLRDLARAVGRSEPNLVP